MNEGSYMLHSKQKNSQIPWLQAIVVAFVMTGLLYQPAFATDADEKKPETKEATEEKAEEAADEHDEDVPQAAIDMHPELEYDPTTPLEWQEVIIRPHKFAIASSDGKHRIGIRGRLQTDVAYNLFDSNDTVNRAEFGDERTAHYGTWHRRIRMGMLGVMYNRWEWQVEPEFRDTEVRFANLYMAYLFDHGRLAFGHFKEPFSMESHTSSRRITFLERAAPVDALRPSSSRSIGLMYETLRPGWYLGGGIFGGNTWGAQERERDINEGWATTFRGSFAPLDDQSQALFVHLGGSFQHRENAYGRGDDLSVDGDGEEMVKGYMPVRKRTRTGQRAAEVRFVGRHDLEGIKHHQTYALEAATGYERLTLQGEYLWANFNRPDDLTVDNFAGELEEAEIDNVEWLDYYDETVTQSGWYIEGTFFLSNDRRTYRSFSGDFGNQYVSSPVSEGGAGAWMLTARYAHMNGYTDQYAVDADGNHLFDEDLFEGDQYAGGQKVDRFTLGLNWFPETGIVTKLNVMYMDGRYQKPVENLAGDPEVRSTKGWSFALRFQYEW